MGLLNGFIEQAATHLKSLTPARPVVGRLAGHGIGRKGNASELDFMSAVHAHRHWKIRLSDYVQRGLGEALDHRLISRDDQSELGRWIHGDAGFKFGHLPSFSQLRTTHAQFHLAAGRIVQLHQQGDCAEALQLMRGGEYPRQSLRVMGLLGALYDESVRRTDHTVGLSAAKRQLARSVII